MKLTQASMTTNSPQLEFEVHRLAAENRRLKRILAFEANTLAGELLDCEERLDQANRDLRSVLNNMPSMIGYWDKNLRNRFGNAAYVEWFGDAAASMTGKHIREVIGEERYQLNLPFIEAAQRGERQEFERAILSPDGKQTRYSLAQYLPDIVDGQVQGFYVLVSDVSSIKKAEMAIRERDNKLRGLYEVAPLGIGMVDMNGRIVEANEMLCKICGYSADELKELDYLDLTPQRYAEQESAQMRQMRQTGRYGPFEKEYLRKDGCLVPVRVHGILVTGNDGKSYGWGIVEDMTRERQAEQLNQVLDEYQELSEQAMQRARGQVVVALTDLSVIRDNETGLHTRRTQLYVKTLAQALVQSGHYAEHLSGQHIDLIVKATPMHDLGKVGIPDHILLKPDRLTDEETQVIRTHAMLGESILLVMAGAGRRADDSLFAVAAKIAGAHHENWDGSGYPRGLSGQDIPLAARLMALADVYDALTTARVYKRAWTHEEASAHILSLRGTKFDPAVVDAFGRAQADFKAIALELADA